MHRREFLIRSLVLAAAWRAGPAWALESGNFRAVYDDPTQRDRFFLFLQNVFHLYPEERFHQLIIDLCAAETEDERIYLRLLEQLPEIKTLGGDLTYSLPALKKQKEEMARQAAALLADVPRVDGYMEVGTTGRYMRGLAERVEIEGPLYVLNDVSPSFGPIDVIERGRVRKIGTYVRLGEYDPIDPSRVPDASLDLVSNLIGFHHCPDDRLAGFIQGIHRVLRPGGRLLVREHDVADERMDTFVALAHDVFNAGVSIPWTENAKQVRRFRSVEEWTALLTKAGFERQSGAELQAHDPTDNTLLAFVKA